MQPADDPKYLNATHTLITYGTLLFELVAYGPHSRPVQCGSRTYIDIEQWFNSFVVELACVIWAIGPKKAFVGILFILGMILLSCKRSTVL